MSALARTRPIFFSGPMVRAIMEDRKTQTRRVIKLERGNLSPDHAEHWLFGPGNNDARSWAWPVGEDPSRELLIRCPFGQPGDRLWVRETWKYEPGDSEPTWDELMYDLKEAGGDCGWWPPNQSVFYRASETPDMQKAMKPWRSPLHMFRDLSRLTLEVTEVRVERLQEVSEENARAEGAGTAIWSIDVPGRAGPLMSAECYKAGFACLWDSLNTKRGHSWKSNPRVWIVSFKRIDQP